MNQAQIQELIDDVKEAIEDLLNEMSEILYPIEELAGFIDDIESFKEEHDMEFETDFEELKFKSICSLVEGSDEYSEVLSKLKNSIFKFSVLKKNTEGAEFKIDKYILEPLENMKLEITELYLWDSQDGIINILKKAIKKLESIEV